MKKKTINFIKKALAEDIGSGDITSMACIPENSTGSAKLISRENCKIAGIEIAKEIYSFYDYSLKFKTSIKDGEKVSANQIIFTISGNQRSILATERLMLNCMQRMSGIATKTNKYLEKIKDLNTILLDTRKTCPNIRFLDKQAVNIGGGGNHRHGLYDAIMIKDNHIDFSGGIKHAIENCKNYLKKKQKKVDIIIEARSLKEVNEIIQYGDVDRILLDNFSIKDTKKAVQIINKKYLIESSGNIDINNIRDYALCGVNYISIGKLTHSIKSIDLSLISI